MLRIGLIGFGAIGSSIYESWQSTIADRGLLTAILVRPEKVHKVKDQVCDEVVVCGDLKEFLAFPFNLVIEAAGHGAVEEFGEQLLAVGCDLCVLSIGALSNDNLRQKLIETAERMGAKIYIPSGALAGFDGLLSMRTAGLQSVKYVSCKPPRAWKGTIAEQHFDLDALKGATVIFSGNARQAARSFPANANLAAAVALAGMGFEQTRVDLIADPNLDANVGRLIATSCVGELDLTLTGGGFLGNPKTSAITAMSALSVVQKFQETMTFI
jgi:aspartate dehydrogenase